MPVKSALSTWLDNALSEALGFPATSEITEYILSFETVDEQVDYLKEILDLSNSVHAQIIVEFQSRIGPPAPPQGGPVALKAYKKAAEPEEFKGTGKKSAKNKNDDIGKGQKGKTKYVSLYSKDGVAKDMIMRQGRHPCECQTLKHALVNNCTDCGRIVCEQEGSGPCMFCGSLVCTKEEQEVLNRNSRKSDQLLKKLLTNPVEDQSKALAEQRKNQLLEYDKNSEKRTKVIDDESDYFSVDSDKWLSHEQRDKLRKREQELRDKRHGSRLNRKITFDFAGRRVVEEDSGLANYDPSQDKIVQDIMKLGPSQSHFVQQIQHKTLTDGDGVVNPNIKIPRPMRENPRKIVRETFLPNRIQDKELQVMSDGGFCMTMHQPYASLLVCGIKKDEGRTWYSAHRGRLWIHAASRPPAEQEINEIHDMYKMFHGASPITFPSSYPTSCLLGSVDVDEILSQEDYRDKYPRGESSSPFVFVCSNPQELLVKFPMSGQHKIYKLDPGVHQSAKKAVKKAPVEI
ncbi:hypothetical protein TCAL_05511 [Tigriopus californicus]|uniref:ASCH domain-containing protein n=1 Tax=Tigriopus californicus TaxID=6832 RepID=A0A553NND3_TIGCA|nr:hypothetical protein TCAL_05511 [Tigriopus californicus]